jgi:hypothetical protein
MTAEKMQQLDPLRDLLEAVISRIESLEAHAGITPKTPLASGSAHSIGFGSAHGSTSLQKASSVKHIGGSGRLERNV